MKKRFAVAAFALLASCGASAGVVEKACLNSDRAQSNRQLCGCIQQVADMTLDGREQRQAAKFFAEPHQAQEIRQSDRPNHEVFWKKYRHFGATAESYCS
ncbi:hypothetical protein EKE94_00465 [Mesobaculum littorinae]|uniref:Arginine transporter n=1 Tax=Mesobaculum littorinae TaxID=2486419 RepID=A0A438AKR7_9RHOB|nr:hypothetical protein [Mesobaculum littorinae]RVV99205.1 hypothetical protein EKE94_00465 [Mesobaculum littorinae]